MWHELNLIQFLCFALCRFCELCKHRFEFAPSKSLTLPLSLSCPPCMYLSLLSLTRSHICVGYYPTLPPLFQFSLSSWHASASPYLWHHWWDHVGHDQQPPSLVSPRLCGLHVAHPCTHLHMWVSFTLHLWIWLDIGCVFVQCVWLCIQYAIDKMYASTVYCCLIFQIEFTVFCSTVLSGPLCHSPLTSSHCEYPIVFFILAIQLLFSTITQTLTHTVTT